MPLSSRRALTIRLGAFSAGLALTGRAFAAPAGDGISRTSESIHHQVTIAASRERVYAALTDAAQFTKMTTFSSMKGAPPAKIEPEPGGSFWLFGGHIIGRQLELTPSQRIVQAWRVVDWEPGIYSIARFELELQGAQTQVAFDHTGFPNGLGQHLAEGWKEHYWEPLKKYLA